MKTQPPAPAKLLDLPTEGTAYIMRGTRTWDLCRFDDGAVLVQSLAEEWAPAIGAMLPPHVVAHVDMTCTDPINTAISIACDAEDTALLAAMISLAIDSGAVLSSRVYPVRNVDGYDRTHATVRARSGGAPGYACVTNPGRRVVWSAIEVPHISEDMGLYHMPELDWGPFAAARAFVRVVGGPSAAWALRVAKEAALIEAKRLDAARGALVGLLRKRTAQRCHGRPSPHVADGQIVVECTECVARIELPIRLDPPDDVDRGVGYLENLAWRLVPIVTARWKARYGTGPHIPVS